MAAATLVLVVPSPTGAAGGAPSSPVLAAGSQPVLAAQKPPVSEADIWTQYAMLDKAVQEVEQAEMILRDTEAKEGRVLDAISLIRAELKNLAIDAYMNVGSGERREVMLSVAEVDSAVKRRALVKAISGDRVTLVEQLEVAKRNLEGTRADAEKVARLAREHRVSMIVQLAKLKTAQDYQAALVATPRTAPVVRENLTVASPNGTLVTVRGIVVDRSIADNLEAMMSAAEADGVVLSGGGYRDPAAQRRLRRQNCPSENSSPSSCSPPTARPGHSMHEKGLAVDFSADGIFLSSRSTAGYQWLAANAERYGFFNLPSEPWHWSVNGN